jgi:hypothetical protein
MYKTLILPLVMYGCNTWVVTLTEEHGLRVFQNRVLRRIFGPKRDVVTGGWQKLHNWELHNLYSLPTIIKTIKSMWMRWAGHVACMRKGGGQRMNAYRTLVGWKRPLGRHRYRWEYNIKRDLK